MKTRIAQSGFALLMLSTLSPLESADALTDGELIDQYAPRFYFSLDNRWCFPVSPFNKKGVCDNDKSALYSAPTYATVTKCGPGVHKISYYLYWGKQNAACGPVTAHRHDWEHVTVHVLNDAVEAVTYYQHKGWYTYGPIDMESPTSPKVYVGEWGHGMYHDKRGEGGGGCSQTGYWQDTRRNQYVLNPGERLIDIKTLGESQKAQLSNKEWGKATPPLVFEKDNNLCSLPPCKADGCDRRWPYGRPSALTHAPDGDWSQAHPDTFMQYVTWNGDRYCAKVFRTGFVHAPAGSGSCDWSRALLDSKINYVTWDGTKWQAKVNGSTFTHAPQSDLRRTHTSDHLNYKFPDGTKWSMKATNPG